MRARRDVRRRQHRVIDGRPWVGGPSRRRRAEGYALVAREEALHLRCGECVGRGGGEEEVKGERSRRVRVRERVRVRVRVRVREWLIYQ